MQLTIVMYHYVREIKNSKYPKIKGLELDGFKRQLDYLENHYDIIRAEDLINYVVSGKQLPDHPCYLTFDDGYKDHLDYVLPELLKRKLQGSFFPPVKPVTERQMLDVNSIHFILASSTDDAQLVNELNQLCLDSAIHASELDEYWNTYASANRFDTKEVIYFKRMLQHVLPEQLRHNITALLFQKYVDKNEKNFANELYLSRDDLKKLIDCGMYVGSHGYSHCWLNKVSPTSQMREIDSSLEFLKSLGAPTENWIMCYPYGAYDAHTLDILKSKKCAVGLTTKVDFAELEPSKMLELSRFDTNDLPQ